MILIAPRQRFPFLIAGIAAAFLGLFLLYPLWKVFGASFFDASGTHLTLRNYVRLATSNFYRSSLLNSLSIGAMATLCATALAVPFAIVAVGGEEFAVATRHGVGETLTLSLRPEALRLLGEREPPPDGWHRLLARLTRVELLGAVTRLETVLGNGLRLQVAVLDAPLDRLKPGAEVTLAYDPRRVTTFVMP